MTLWEAKGDDPYPVLGWESRRIPACKHESEPFIFSAQWMTQGRLAQVWLQRGSCSVTAVSPCDGLAITLRLGSISVSLTSSGYTVMQDTP